MRVIEIAGYAVGPGFEPQRSTCTCNRPKPTRTVLNQRDGASKITYWFLSLSETSVIETANLPIVLKSFPLYRPKRIRSTSLAMVDH